MVKRTGVARKVDQLGRVVLPAEVRRHFGIRPGDM
ncbi:MAG: AbrB/MazE/SpoVT family DNA-binding domain-containing protein, partial [Actinomycetota bacterium]|nr:AbrB/MazE/SpoVT family DNA-binding domain-containing protein [Actinomycetota bacterium]